MSKVTNGRAAGFTDSSVEDGGTGTGFRPHELMEAALASCINITLRVYSERHSVPLEDVSTTVTLDHSSHAESVFHCEIELVGAELSAEQRTKLLEIAKGCSVRRTLSRPIRFDYGDAADAATVTSAG